MDEEIAYSLEEANYITSNQNIPAGERTLSDWILMLFYADKDNPVDGITRVANDIFLMYNEIIAKETETDLFVLFKRSDLGVYSEDIENTVEDLLSINYLQNEDESRIDLEGSILLGSKGTEYIRGEFDRLPPTTKETIQRKRKEWDQFSMTDLIKYIDREYPVYSLLKRAKSDIWYEKGDYLLFNVISDDINNINKAIMNYNKALAINPDHDLAWLHKGEALQKLKKHKEAVECFDRSIEINPKLIEAWRGRFDSLGELGMKDEAAKTIEKIRDIIGKEEIEQNKKYSMFKQMG
jgi:tetratricopeptide (TPR) repeat protein